MARVEIPEVVFTGRPLVPATGASVVVNLRNGGTANVYSAESGGSTLQTQGGAAVPVLTDSNGRIEAWVEQGSYDLEITYAGVSYTQRFEAARGDAAAGIPITLLDAKGDLVVASAADTPARLAVGANNTILTADSAEATGVKWSAAPSGIVASIVDVKGDLIAATAADTVARLAAGANGTALVADSAETTGLKWLAADQAAGTGSLRTLGTSSTSAKAGNYAPAVRTSHGFVVMGTITAGMTIPPFFVDKESGETLTIEKARYQVLTGTNVTFKVQKNGSDLTGYGTTGSPLTATTTAANTSSSQSLAADDALTLVIVGISGTPANLAVTLQLKHVAAA